MLLSAADLRKQEHISNIKDYGEKLIPWHREQAAITLVVSFMVIKI